jgi:predicted esterase
MKKMLFALTMTVSTLTPFASAHAATPPVKWICPPTGTTTCVGPTITQLVPLSGPTISTTYQSQSQPVADCFFLYPTASPATTWNAPNRATPWLRQTVRSMALPFTRTCRLVAPVYQQVTLAHLAMTTATERDRAAVEVSYQSVRRAWREYLKVTPSDRPVILIGFSQGAAMLAQLLRREIAPHPQQVRRVILSELVGGGLTVTSPRSVNDGLAGVPLCLQSGSIHCVIAYDAFTSPPSADALTGRPGAPWGYLSGWTPTQGLKMACVNPVYGGRLGGPLTPYLGPDVSSAYNYVAGATYTTYAKRFRAACEVKRGIDWLDIRQIDPPKPIGRPNPLPSLPWGSDDSIVGLHRESWGLTLGNLVLATRAAVSAWTIRSK